MSVDRTLAVMLRVLRQLRRDHRSMAMILVAPPLLLTIVWGIYYHEAGIFDRIGPLMLGLFPFTSMFLVTSITTLRERTQGTLEGGHMDRSDNGKEVRVPLYGAASYRVVQNF